MTRTTAAKPAKGRRLAVGLCFNLRRTDAIEEAEFDTPATIARLSQAIRANGHDVVELEATRELPGLLAKNRVDLVFNIAEGYSGLAREAQVPALLDLMGVPYTGADARCMVVTLDKALTKYVLAAAGVPTTRTVLLEKLPSRLPRDLRYPAFVKPVAEGSSKGVTGANIVADEAALRARVGELLAELGQPVLVEDFLPGREVTVALIGGDRPEVLPPSEVVFLGSGPQCYGRAEKTLVHNIRNDYPADLTDKEFREIAASARTCWRALGCRDVARMDFRQDARGRFQFIECNALPGMAPDYSDLVLIARSAGIEYDELIGRVLGAARKRLGI